MPKIKGGGKKGSTLVGCKVNEELLNKIDTMLDQEPAPYASRAEFVYTLIAEYFGKDEQRKLEKEALIVFIKTDPDIADAIRERALAILSEDLKSATQDE
ncbi:hypothetical protein R6Y95_06105 [Methanoculleus palmolei]|uniref:Uncharacterized protein n=1 Tax=Methanoculleus palmolei TaxID=72612 RepID=A0ABD8A662_9EURY|nr:hypothetical protein R6Y95_06105 [Methanoculleus palmolei]